MRYEVAYAIIGVFARPQYGTYAPRDYPSEQAAARTGVGL